MNESNSTSNILRLENWALLTGLEIQQHIYREYYPKLMEISKIYREELRNHNAPLSSHFLELELGDKVRLIRMVFFKDEEGISHWKEFVSENLKFENYYNKIGLESNDICLLQEKVLKPRELENFTLVQIAEALS